MRKEEKECEFHRICELKEVENREISIIFAIIYHIDTDVGYGEIVGKHCVKSDRYVVLMWKRTCPG